MLASFDNKFIHVYIYKNIDHSCQSQVKLSLPTWRKKKEESNSILISFRQILWFTSNCHIMIDHKPCFKQAKSSLYIHGCSCLSLQFGGQEKPFTYYNFPFSKKQDMNIKIYLDGRNHLNYFIHAATVGIYMTTLMMKIPTTCILENVHLYTTVEKQTR